MNTKPMDIDEFVKHAIGDDSIKLIPTKIELNTIEGSTIKLAGGFWHTAVTVEIGAEKATVTTRSLINALLAIQSDALDNKT